MMVFPPLQIPGVGGPTGPLPVETHDGQGHNSHPGSSGGDVSSATWAGCSGLWEWEPAWVWLLFAVLLTTGYVVGMVVFHNRGIAWPAGRLAAWLAGVASLLAVTGTGVGYWGGRLFSVHMAQHMVLSMLTPILLLLGAPVTLALRALPATRARSGGPRRALLAALNSRMARLLCHPAVTVTAFVVSLFGLYFTGLLDLAMAAQWAHQLMLIHFLVVGLAFFGSVLAVDPWPGRSSPALRLAEMALMAPFHAFFGLIVMQTTQPLSMVFAASTRRAGLDPVTDQALGAGIAWGFGEVPVVIVTIIVFAQWFSSDLRAARRLDRQADRDNGAALASYNRWLNQLHRGGHEPPPTDGVLIGEQTTRRDDDAPSGASVDPRWQHPPATTI